jgi:hypothetical protein
MMPPVIQQLHKADQHNGGVCVAYGTNGVGPHNGYACFCHHCLNPYGPNCGRPEKTTGDPVVAFSGNSGFGLLLSEAFQRLTTIFCTLLYAH